MAVQPHFFDTVSLQQRGDLPVLQVANRHGEATIALQGAQLLEYTPRGEQPVVWLSDHADYRRGQSVRGGIPVCWPWFGAIERNPVTVQQMARGADLPAHGLVRDRDWTLTSITENDDLTQITLGFVTDQLTQPRWPHSAELQLKISIGRTLGLALTTRNLGPEPIAISQALHTYFSISDIGAVSLDGFHDCRYLDALAGWRESRQQGAITIASETDRIYSGVAQELLIRDRDWGRTVRLLAAGSRSAVVWNPWIEKTKRLSQLAPEAWRGFVCIETANVGDDAISLAEGAAHTLSLTLATSTILA